MFFFPNSGVTLYSSIITFKICYFFFKTTVIYLSTNKIISIIFIEFLFFKLLKNENIFCPISFCKILLSCFSFAYFLTNIINSRLKLSLTSPLLNVEFVNSLIVRSGILMTEKSIFESISMSLKSPKISIHGPFHKSLFFK